ncbi:MAG: enoyl-CoA hydratase/isomerase family protein [Candidatus Eremiobacterota bacterium]
MRIKVSVHEGVARVRLDHPPLNILDIAMLDELREAVHGLPEVRALVVETPHKAFSAGASVEEHLPEQADSMLRAFHAALEAVLDFPAPTLAAVNGAAMGGGMELALACDFVLASDNAKFGQPEIKLAVFPPLAAVLLPRLIPHRMAWELVLTGRTVSAQRALELGLVNRVAPSEELEKAVQEFLAMFHGLSPAALRLCKKALRLGSDYKAALRDVERVYLEELMREPDAVEGLRAFLEKRAPVWTGVSV